MLNIVLHAITHLLGKPIATGLVKKIQAADTSEFLEESELWELKDRIELVRRRRFIAGCATVLLSVTAAIGGLYAFVRCTELPPLDPILDQRTPFRRLVAPFLGLLIGGLLTVVIGRLIVRMEFGTSSNLFWRYLATKTKLDVRRTHKWEFLIGIPLAVVMLILVVSGGAVVDARGILKSDGLLSSTVHPYNEISAVFFYSRVDAPSGIVTRDNICIRLKSGEEFRIDYAKDVVGDPPVRNVAKYIGEKSGVPVTVGDIRPR